MSATTADTPAGTGIGASVRRVEDQRFITGRGSYVDDLERPGQVHAHVVRSSVAHGEIRRIGTDAARAAPGVLGVYVGEDLRADGIGDLPCGWFVSNIDGTPMFSPSHPVVAVGRVRYVGEPVAVVIAETAQQARDAAELLEVEIDDLPAVATLERALAPGAPAIWDGAPGNVSFHWQIGDRAAVESAFARADHVAKLELVNNRLVCNAMEPRAAIGEYDAGRGEYTLWTTSQNPHVIRILLATVTLKVPEHKIRVISPDVGGGFGSKAFHYSEEVIAAWAARRVGRPVRWTADRSEAFVSDRHGRDHLSHVELACTKDGRFLALRVSTAANMGAYYSTFGPAIPTFYYAPLLSGTYAIPAIYCDVKGVVTNTVPVDAYRGAGRPEATYVIERIVDRAARDLGIDPAEIRRRNFVPKDAFPYRTALTLEYDSGDYAQALDKALALADYAGFPARKQASAARGKLRGIGLSSYIEACGVGPSKIIMTSGGGSGLFESACVRVNPSGSVVVMTGSHSHGQGHETTFAQLVSERLGVPLESVEVVHGDTGRIQFGLGTYGSRSLAVGGSAIWKAVDKVIAKGKKIAAHVLEAAESDVRFENGRFVVAGTDRGLSFPELAFTAHAPLRFPSDEIEPGLEETAFYDPSNFTFPAGVHVCELEIDPATGVSEVVRYTVVDDFGTVVNPMIVDGQVHGGVAQGIGQALLGTCVYDEDSAQLVSGSFVDYTMPRADDLPTLAVDYIVTPCPHNPIGAKGCGEAGAIAAPPAVMNAVVDALAARGVGDVQMPATPHRVWQALRAAAKPAAA
ncbi:MAG: xanthine dehydrogenase family protein molybdopterin-binding subunit [Pseudomonadota bacterium]